MILPQFFNLFVSICLSQYLLVHHKVESSLSVRLMVLWQVQEKFDQAASMFKSCDYFLTFCSFKMTVLHLSKRLRHFAFQKVERAKSSKLITAFWNTYHGNIRLLRASKKHKIKMLAGQFLYSCHRQHAVPLLRTLKEIYLLYMQHDPSSDETHTYHRHT